ncbi:proprotein convertase P-domain-containing protein [Streptomyces cyanogenus]|uniref:proprotein convertase P-domain-containing protein n=1 Tax=Streptomyces cyanogenus TaxID=80860 RepID=UPI003C7EC89F
MVAGFSGSAPKALQVAVGVTHEWLGDVKIDLVSPDGRTYGLQTTSVTFCPPGLRPPAAPAGGQRACPAPALTRSRTRCAGARCALLAGTWGSGS